MLILYFGKGRHLFVIYFVLLTYTCKSVVFCASIFKLKGATIKDEIF